MLDDGLFVVTSEVLTTANKATLRVLVITGRIRQRTSRLPLLVFNVLVGQILGAKREAMKATAVGAPLWLCRRAESRITSLSPSLCSSCGTPPRRVSSP